MTIGEITNMVCRDLPEDWELSIVLEAGCGIVTLHDPDGNRIKDASSNGETIEVQVIQALAYAKAEVSQ